MTNELSQNQPSLEVENAYLSLSLTHTHMHSEFLILSLSFSVAHPKKC